LTQIMQTLLDCLILSEMLWHR